MKMNDIVENISDTLPVMMYLHGFMSGANGAKQRQLQRQFKGRYRVIAPELDADPDSSLEVINRAIREEHPEIIIGTSLGGFMALECESGDADVVIVNPCLFPKAQLAQWVGEEHTYFCKRLDGVQTYTLTQATLDKYERYDAVQSVRDNAPRVAALCSTADDLLGDSHVKALTGLVWDGYFKVVDDFGHQCKDAGMTHLYDLLELVIDRRRRMGGSPMSFSDFEEMVRTRPQPEVPGFYRLTVRSYEPDQMDLKRVYVNRQTAEEAACDPMSFRLVRRNGDVAVRMMPSDRNEKVFNPDSADYATFHEAAEAMNGLVGSKGILDFEIRHYPFGIMSQTHRYVELWMYDFRGSLIQKSTCSPVHNRQPGIYGKFFGHLPDSLPYRKGDIVIVFEPSPNSNRTYAMMGVIAEEPHTVKKGYEYYRRVVKRRERDGLPVSDWLDEENYPGYENDRYLVQTGFYNESMNTLSYRHPMEIFPVKFPVGYAMVDLMMQWHSQYCELRNKDEHLHERIASTLENEHRNRVYGMGRRTQACFGIRFHIAKRHLFEHIDEILADPAQRSTPLPIAYHHTGEKKVMLGAYLTWWRDNGYAPDECDKEEWNAFLEYNNTFNVSDTNLQIIDIINMYTQKNSVSL